MRFGAIALSLALLVSACGESTPPPAPTGLPPADYAGVWTGGFNITSCTDIDVPGLNQLHLCPFPTQRYRLTLTQVGTTVAGSYELLSEYYSCACGVLGYGTLNGSGAIASDGTLTFATQGSVRATGVTALVTFTVRQSSTSTITGTVSGRLRFGSDDDRSVFTGVVTSGSR
jgi:hypothetical protein